jgi:hypothetical protein
MTFLQYVATALLGKPISKGGQPGEWYWECPFCGKEKFHTLPSRKENKDKFRCFVCGEWGDEWDIITKIALPERPGREQARLFHQLKQAYEAGSQPGHDSHGEKIRPAPEWQATMNDEQIDAIIQGMIEQGLIPKGAHQLYARKLKRETAIRRDREFPLQRGKATSKGEISSPVGERGHEAGVSLDNLRYCGKCDDLGTLRNLAEDLYFNRPEECKAIVTALQIAREKGACLEMLAYECLYQHWQFERFRSESAEHMRQQEESRKRCQAALESGKQNILNRRMVNHATSETYVQVQTGPRSTRAIRDGSS